MKPPLLLGLSSSSSSSMESEMTPLIPPSSFSTLELKVLGMTCASCSNSVEKSLLKLDGVVSASVALLQNRALVEFDPTRVKEERIKEAIDDAGFDAEILSKPVAEPISTKSSTTRTFRITGLTCAACVNSVESILLSLDGVMAATVGLASNMGEVTYDPSLIDSNKIIAAINDAGFEAELQESKSRNVAELVVEGMISQADERVVQNVFYQMQGLKEFHVDPLLQRVKVTFNPDVIKLRAIVEAIENTGSGKFTVRLSPRKSPYYLDRNSESRKILHLLRWSLVFSIPVLFLGIICPRIPVFHSLITLCYGHFSLVEWLKWVLVTPVQFIIGRRFYLGAYRSLKNMSANMDVLVVLGTTSAYIYSIFALIHRVTTGEPLTTYFETTIMLINVVLLGKYLEIVAKGKTSEAIEKLLKLAPSTATILTVDCDGNPSKEMEIDVQLVERGDILKVTPGSRIPADGLVIWGSSRVDESMITGEASPVAKEVGENVIGGTLNTSGALHIRVTCVGSESALAQIIHMVEAAQMVKAPIQKFADFVASIFVPVVVSLALVTWLCWYLAGRYSFYSQAWLPMGTNYFEFALMFSISVLVIACPCALGLATPTAVMVATGVGAKNGVLIKGGDALERAKSVKCIIFDKTGTLTKGKPHVSDIKMFSGRKMFDLLEMVASAEAESEHPLAKAIVEYVSGRSYTNDQSMDEPSVAHSGWLRKVSSFKAIPGRGVNSVVDGNNILAGNRRLLQEAGVIIPSDAEVYLLEIEKKARCEVLVAVNGRLEAILGIADPLKLEASVVIDKLKGMGIQSIMVTGDNWITAKAVAREAGIKQVMAEVLPGEKAEIIRQLQKDGSVIAMVGDGINDSPALAMADVGMALGAGTDIAIEAADFVLMTSNLEGVVTAIDLSKKTFTRIRLNYLFAVAYNIVAVPIAAGAFYPWLGLRLPPWAAAAAMAMSSVTVVCSSLLLNKYTRPQLSEPLFQIQISNR